MNLLRFLRFALGYGPTIYRILKEIHKLFDGSDKSKKEIAEMIKRISKEENFKVIEYLACLMLECKK